MVSIKHWAQLLYAIKFIKTEGGRRAVLTRLHTLTLIKTQKHQGVPGFLLLSSGYILMVTLETCEHRLGDFFEMGKGVQACLVKRPGLINWGLQGEARTGEHMSSHLLIASPMQVPSPNMMSCWTTPIPPAWSAEEPCADDTQPASSPSFSQSSGGDGFPSAREMLIPQHLEWPSLFPWEAVTAEHDKKGPDWSWTKLLMSLRTAWNWWHRFRTWLEAGGKRRGQRLQSKENEEEISVLSCACSTTERQDYSSLSKGGRAHIHPDTSQQHTHICVFYKMLLKCLQKLV